jgi:integrase
MRKCKDASSRTSRSESRFLLLRVRIFSFWSADEVKHFLEWVRGDRDCALYYLDLTTGRRCDELLGVKWACTDMDIGNSRSSRP